MGGDRIRITSKEIYCYYLKGVGLSGGCSNRRILEDKLGVNYNVFRRTFEGSKKNYYEDDDVIVIRVRSIDFEKGKQSIVRRGKGGMERFAQYVMKRNADY